MAQGTARAAVEGVRTIAYRVQFQTEARYQSVQYGGNSIYNSACGPASLCNALSALGIAEVDIPTMCRLAVSCGARVSGGTVMATLLKQASQNYQFRYKTTSKNAELLAHLNAGGAAILNQGDAYGVFANGGHYVAAVKATGETITVLDSYWNSTKYLSWPQHHAKRTGQKGVVQASLTQCGKATIDRAPSYYLIARAADIPEPKEDDMTYYKNLDDIPEYYRPAVQKLVNAGAIAGTGDGLNLSEDLCRAFAILDNIGLLPGEV